MTPLIKRVSLFLALALASAEALALEKVSTPAKPCPLKALKDGHEIPWSSLKGKVVYLDFWASWCGPCAQSFPFMTDLAKTHQKDGLEIVAISVDESREEAEGFLKQHPQPLTIAYDPEGVCPKEYGLETMPTSYLIDRKGQLRHVHRGFARSDQGELTRTVDELLKEKP